MLHYIETVAKDIYGQYYFKGEILSPDVLERIPEVSVPQILLFSDKEDTEEALQELVEAMARYDGVPEKDTSIQVVKRLIVTEGRFPRYTTFGLHCVKNLFTRLDIELTGNNLETFIRVGEAQKASFNKC